MTRRYGTGKVKHDTVRHVYRARWKDETGKEHSKSFPLSPKGYADANEFLDSLNLQKKQGFSVGTAKTLGEAITELFEIEKQVRPGYRQSSRTRDVQAAEKLTTLSSIPLDRLTDDDINSLYNKMRNGEKPFHKKYAPSTIKKTHIILKAVFKRACRGKNRLSYNPMDSVSCPQIPESEADFYTDSDLEKIFAGLDFIANNKYNGSQHNYSIFFRLLATNGLRVGEACALMWEDINWDNRTISIKRSWDKTRRCFNPPKTKRGFRTLQVFSDKVWSYLLEHRQKSGLIFHTRNDLPLGYTNIKDTLKKAKDISGVNHGNIHSFRHTAITNWLYQNNGNILEAADMAGHKDPTVTATIYRHVLQEINAKNQTKYRCA